MLSGAYTLKALVFAEIPEAAADSRWIPSR